jgi:hypothetical protein
LGAARGKALAAQHRPSGLRLERNAVSFSTLIASYLKALALASAATLSGATKVLAARVTTGLTALGVGQATLAIIILLSFSKRKGRSTLGASDFLVRHDFLRVLWVNVPRVYSCQWELYKGILLEFRSSGVPERAA